MTMTYNIAATNHSFSLADPIKAGAANTVPFSLFHMTLDAANAMASKRATVLADSDLTGPGKERRLLPVFQVAWAVLCASYIRLAEIDAATEKREAALHQVPKLDPTHSACAVEDAECRSVWRSMPLSERTKIMEAMGRDPEAGQRYLRLQVAVLRAPMPVLAPHEAAWFADQWRLSKRLGNPGEALAIDAAKDASSWSFRGHGFLQGVIAGISGWSRVELLNWLVLDPIRIGAAAALGFGVMEVAAAKQQAAARKA